MFFYILWNFLIGYLVIRVEGVSLEKFINLTVTNGIYLWGINRQNYTTLTAKISIKGFRKLHGLSRKVHCRIRIVDKRGLPFIIYRYRNRKMLAVGMVVFVLILYGFSSFVWSVEVQGTESISPEKLIKELEALGVKPGAFKPMLDSFTIENQIILNMPGISWASLELRGSRAILRVKESVKPPAIVDKDTPSNIVASKDGIIHDMIVLDGQAVVKEGDTVKEGQLLISGIIDHSDTIGVRYVHSMGQVIARTWYEETLELSLNEPYRQRTGRKAEIKYIGWDRLKVPYSKEAVEYADYDVEVLKDGFFITEIYYEVEEVYWKSNIKKARKKLEELAEEKVKQAVPRGAKIIDKKVKYDMIESDKLIAVIYIEALEDIGMQQTIVTQ